jgi:hypothetical protein
VEANWLFFVVFCGFSDVGCGVFLGGFVFSVLVFLCCTRAQKGLLNITI